jgi:hypothetical protein
VTVIDMTRKKTSFRLDERILKAIQKASETTGRSRNAWLEHHLFTVFKSTGQIEGEPLGETRGGDRTQSKSDEGVS